MAGEREGDVQDELNDSQNQEINKGKKRKATLKLSDAVFRDNEVTEGGRVKGRKEVVKHRVSEGGSQPHANCRVQTFGSIVGELSPMKVNWVKEMGLGGLLHLQGKSLPRSLCYWLMSKVDPMKRVFISSPGFEYPFHKNQVFWVLGIPKGPRKVPLVVFDERIKGVVEAVYEKYGVVTAGKTRYISMPKVMDTVERECSLEDEYEFKVAFLVLALADVLCPTTCLRLAIDLVPALSVAMEAQLYDWSSLVLERLMYSARRFALNFYRDGYAKGCGGCSYFLAIFYLDRLNRIPVQWGLFPRIRAWEDDDVNKAKIEDRLDRGPAADYGRLEFVDVAYGEQHPRAARDTGRPHSLAKEVAKMILSGFGEGEEVRDGEGEEVEPEIMPGGKRKARRKGPPDNSNPYLRKLAKRARERICLGETSSSGCMLDSGTSGGGLHLGTSTAGRFGKAGGGGDGSCGNHEGMRDMIDVRDGTVYMSQEELVNTSDEEDCTDATIRNVLKTIGSDSLSLFSSPRRIPVGPDGKNSIEADVLESSGRAVDRELVVEFSAAADDFEEVGEKTGNMENEEGGSSHSECDSGVESGGDAQDGVQDGVEKSDLDVSKDAEICDGEPENLKGRKLTRSRPRRGTKPSEIQKNKDFVVSMVPRKKPLIKARLLKYVKALGGQLHKDPSNNSRSDPVMIRVGEKSVTVRNCYALLSPSTLPLNEKYVSVAGALYTKMWKRKFGDSSVRYMLDPSYATTLFKEQGPPSEWSCIKNLAEGYGKEFLGLPAERFHVIFVPVVEGASWWCAAYSVNTDEIWVIDPSVDKAKVADVHDLFLRKLCFGVDMFLNTLDQSWEIGKSAGWARKAVSMELKTEGTGVRMLAAIKGCADRYRTEISTTTLVEEGGMILTEDVTDESNEAISEVKEILGKEIEVEKRSVQ